MSSRPKEDRKLFFRALKKLEYLTVFEFLAFFSVMLDKLIKHEMDADKVLPLLKAQLDFLIGEMSMPTVNGIVEETKEEENESK